MVPHALRAQRPGVPLPAHGTPGSAKVLLLEEANGVSTYFAYLTLHPYDFVVSGVTVSPAAICSTACTT